MEKKKIIIDCDPGVDDAVALAYAAANQDIFELLAVTTVSGSQSIEKTTKNALDLTAFFGLNVPVAKGMQEPIVREPEYMADIHGENGLGQVVLAEKPGEMVKEQAVFYMKKILSELPEGEKASLVCTGPLTNMSLLLRFFPDVKTKIEEILFAGGAAGTGDITSCAEFNMYADPEAAEIVFKSGVPLVMCGLNASRKCTLTRHQILKLCQVPNEVSKLCGDMVGYKLENTSDKYRGMTDMQAVVPLMYLVHPEIFTPEKAILDIDCSEGMSRGAMRCDFRWWEREEDEMNDLVLMDADGSRFQEYLIRDLYELGEKMKEQ